MDEPMRTIALLLLIALAACASGIPEDPVFIDDFIARSTAVQCEPVPALNTHRSPISAVATLSDTSFLILYDQDREVVIVGPDLAPRQRIALAADDPAALDMPSGAALLGDSLLSIADQTRMRLKVFDLQGREREEIPLDFAPQGLWRAGEQILITPFVVGNRPRTLLYALEDGRPRGLPVPTARYTDGMVNAMANTTSIAHFPDGRIVLTHAVVIPFAQVLTLDAAAPTRAPLPLPDGVHDRYGWLPTGRVTESDGARFLIGTLASAPDERTGDFIYLTKTGRSKEKGSEKALIRVDPDLHYLRSYLLDVNASKLAYLAGQGISLIANMEDEWYSCSTP
jgi:hypothetical protein